MPKTYIHNHGAPHLPPEKRREFRLPGWSEPIPLHGRLEVTDHMLRAMLRPEGPESAAAFAEFVCGVYQANRRGTWLSVVIEPDVAEHVTPRRTARSKTA